MSSASAQWVSAADSKFAAAALRNEAPHCDAFLSELPVQCPSLIWQHTAEAFRKRRHRLVAVLAGPALIALTAFGVAPQHQESSPASAVTAFGHPKAAPPVPQRLDISTLAYRLQRGGGGQVVDVDDDDTDDQDSDDWAQQQEEEQEEEEQQEQDELNEQEAQEAEQQAQQEIQESEQEAEEQNEQAEQQALEDEEEAQMAEQQAGQ
ncbi:MAG TPA: hypothetical protein VMU34_16650 [Mycobacterium sp.]|nr:hypothetical protein [Mycobacterium sp.]